MPAKCRVCQTHSFPDVEQQTDAGNLHDDAAFMHSAHLRGACDGSKTVDTTAFHRLPVRCRLPATRDICSAI